MGIKVDRQAIAEASNKLRNWNRWGKDDQIGTLNHVRPEDIVNAAALIRIGKVFGLGLALDSEGPQAGLFRGHWNPLATTGQLSGFREEARNIREDIITLPVQSTTHWDSVGRISYEGKMYNGVDANATGKNGRLGTAQAKNKMVGRGVLLDIARFKGVSHLADGYGISNDELNRCAKEQNVAIRRGDFVIIRTGQLEHRLKADAWNGYIGGDAPGVCFENVYWSQEKQIAALCSDTWGVEVRPHETADIDQPWHHVAIPALGLAIGEMFYLKELAEDCEADGIYEFFFCAPPLVMAGGTGSPANPQAVK